MSQRPRLKKNTKAHYARLSRCKKMRPDESKNFAVGFAAFYEGYSFTDSQNSDWTRGWAFAAAEQLRRAS